MGSAWVSWYLKEKHFKVTYIKYTLQITMIEGGSEQAIVNKHLVKS